MRMKQKNGGYDLYKTLRRPLTTNSTTTTVAIGCGAAGLRMV